MTERDIGVLGWTNIHPFLRNPIILGGDDIGSL
jgi:hypothetical protein